MTGIEPLRPGRAQVLQAGRQLPPVCGQQVLHGAHLGVQREREGPGALRDLLGQPGQVHEAGLHAAAAPQGVQASRDTQCTTLALNQAGMRFAASGSSAPATVTACWK